MYLWRWRWRCFNRCNRGKWNFNGFFHSDNLRFAEWKTIEEIAEDIVENDLEFEFCQLGTTYAGITYQNCIGYGQYSEAIKSLADELEPKIEDNTWGNLCVSFTRKSFSSTSASATNCYYDKENMPDIKIRSEYIANRDNNKEFPNYADFGKTTSEMKTRNLWRVWL